MPPPVRQEPYQASYPYQSQYTQSCSGSPRRYQHYWYQNFHPTASPAGQMSSHGSRFHTPRPHSPTSSQSDPMSPNGADLPPTPPPQWGCIEHQPKIKPDPLPPLSGSQSLAGTQSRVFSNYIPTHPIRIGKDDVYCTKTGLASYTIQREAAHLPSFLSTKPLLNITRISTGSNAGHIRFHSLTTSSIEMTVNGRSTTLSHKSSLLHHRRRWGFQASSTSSPQMWYWKKDRGTAGAVLEEGKQSKHARVLARMKGDLLTFEQGHLTEANYDEIVFSAVAMAEAARRAGGRRDTANLASAIGDLASQGGSATGGGRLGTGDGCYIQTKRSRSSS